MLEPVVLVSYLKFEAVTFYNHSAYHYDLNVMHKEQVNGQSSEYCKMLREV